MKFIVITLFIFPFLSNNVLAQQSVIPDGGGSMDVNSQHDQMSPVLESEIIQQLKSNEAALRQKGLLPIVTQPLVTGFQWPLTQAPGFNDNGYYTIVNYVDEDNSAGLLDYNCGNRTYNGHQGTDISTWPFPWEKMALNAVQIIAAAPGTIIAKYDGYSDTSCAACPACNWNAVYIMQADGSVAWYGHMKKFSQTAKTVGQTVALGEYLGIVGSAGNSTGPHLHFQVYKDNTYTQLIDPWAGNCNALNGLTSWWNNQQPYHVSTLNRVMTNGAPPVTTGCQYAEASNSKVNFVNGETIYFSSYYRDQEVGQVAVSTVYRPDNSVFATWTQTFNTWYNASWWYFIRVLPNPAPTGMWRYDVSYNGQPVQSSYFAVNETGYTFTGNGNWNVSTNWSNNTIPPAVLPAGSEIIINPVSGGSCILNITQTLNSSTQITVLAGKQFKVLGDLKIL